MFGRCAVTLAFAVMRISVHFVGLLVAHRAAPLYAEVFFDLQVCFDIGQLLLIGQIIGFEAFPIAALDVLRLLAQQKRNTTIASISYTDALPGKNRSKAPQTLLLDMLCVAVRVYVENVSLGKAAFGS